MITQEIREFDFFFFLQPSSEVNSALQGFSPVLFNHEIPYPFYSVTFDVMSPWPRKLFPCFCLPTETIAAGNALQEPGMAGDCLWKMQI